MRIKVILPLLLFSAQLCAQTPEFYAKGKSYYDNNQYREALYYFNKYVSADSMNGEVFKWRGNCFMAFNQLDSALLDYTRAIRLAPSLTEVYYNLGLAYTQKKMLTEAEVNLRRYLRYKPEDPEAFSMLARLVSEDQPDSAIILLEKAVSLKPQEIPLADALAREYFEQGRYADAYAFSRKARASFPHHFELKLVNAYAAFATGRFRECAVLADSLDQSAPDIGFQVLKLKASIMSHTGKEHFKQNGFVIRFRHIQRNNTESLDEWVNTPGHRYHYNTLLDRFRKNEPMGLDEYFMVYYGFTSDKRYSPYFAKDNALFKQLNEGDFVNAGINASNLLQHDEFNPRLFEALYVSRRETGSDYEEPLKNYLAILEGIMATGEGTSFESAMIVTSPGHEYDIISYNGFSSAGQALMHHENHVFDVLTINMDDDSEKKVYFNIDKPFRSLGATLQDTNVKDKEKKKKKKKNK
jgi:tetratricopeptide (TPR) repeat protein